MQQSATAQFHAHGARPGDGFLAYHPDWVWVRECIELSLVHGEPLPGNVRTELARHGLNMLDWIDMDVHARAREMFVLGWLRYEIALHLGLDEAAVARAVGRISPETWKIIHGHAQGMSVRAIHMSTPFSRQWIYRVLHSRGLTPNAQANRATELSARKRDEVRRRWHAGERASSIARQTGATVHQVNYIARKEHR